MLFSATICATDSVAALNLISSEQYPKLFSIVFGEGMINDAVSIILYKTVDQMIDERQFYWYTFFFMVLMFIINCILSSCIGIFFGYFSTWCFKKFNFLTHSTASETVFAFLMAFMGYSLCQMLNLSGVIAVLLIGIIMTHY